MSAVAVGVGVAGAAASYAASASASSAQSKSAKNAQAQQKAQYEQTQKVLTNGASQARSDLQPYADAGNNALNELSWQMGLNTPIRVPTTSTIGVSGDPLWDKLLQQNIDATLKRDPNFSAPLQGGDWNQDAVSRDAYQNLARQYIAAKTAQNEGYRGQGQKGALMQPYGMAQYKRDPGYTPMVNSLKELQATPGYKFQLEQGLQGVNNSAAANGSLLSGGQLKALNNYAQGVASTGYQAAWERAQQAYNAAFSRDTQNKNNTFQRLQSMANNGQQAATQQGNDSMQVGNALANAATSFGNNSANLSLAQGQNQANAIAGANNSFQSLLGYGMTPKYAGGGGWFGGGASNSGSNYGGGYVNEAAIGNSISNWFGQ